MTELVQRLRKAPTFCGCGGFDADVCVEAADEIERLTALLKIDGDHPFPDDFTALDLAVERNKVLLADNERLRVALRFIDDEAHDLNAAEECAREALAAVEDEARFHHPVSDEEEAAIDAAVEDKE